MSWPLRITTADGEVWTGSLKSDFNSFQFSVEVQEIMWPLECLIFELRLGAGSLVLVLCCFL